MRKTSVVLLGLILILTAAVTAPGKGEQPTTGPAWFDMVNCSFCKHLGTQEGLLDHITWEHYDIANGLVSITTVDPQYKEPYLKAMAAMEQVGKDLEAGKRTMADTPMCGFCTAYGMLMMSGAKIEYVQGKNADIVLITSDNPEMVKKIKEYGERTRTELAVLQAAKEATAKEKTQ